MIPAWFPDTITRDIIRGTRLTLSYGLEGMILREVDDARVPDVNIPQIEHHLREADLPVLAIEPGLFEGEAEDRVGWFGDLSLIDDSVRFCERLQCSQIIVGSLPGGDVEGAVDGLRRAAAKLRDRDIDLVVRNEGEGRTKMAELMKVVQGIEYPNVRICWDPAGSEAAGESVDEAVGMIGERLGAVIVRAAHPGTTIDWSDLLSRVHALGFTGPVVLEPAGLDTKGALRAATDLIYAVRSALQSGSSA